MTLAALFGTSLIVLQPTSAPAAIAGPGDDARRDDGTRPDDDATAPGPPA